MKWTPKQCTSCLMACLSASPNGDKINSCIINTAVQVASDPNRVSIATNVANYTHDKVKETGRCNISFISTDALFDMFKHFGFQSGRDVDEYAAGHWIYLYSVADNGIPYIASGTNAYFSLNTEKEIGLGSYTFFICEPTFMTVLSYTPSCTYEYYQSNIKAKSEPISVTSKDEAVW